MGSARPLSHGEDFTEGGLPLKKIRILGIWFNDFTINSLVETVSRGIASNRKLLICNHNLHSVFLFHSDGDYRPVFDRAEYIHADGMPLILWAKLKQRPVSREYRLAYLDFYEPLFHDLNKRCASVFYLGGEPGIAERAIQKLQPAYPNIVFDCSPGYFHASGEENAAVLRKIAISKPNLLLVGMGMPKQEKWILENFATLPNSVIMPCGAFFDYIAGAKKTPPRWLSKFSLEWLYRFLCEPRRLFFRYFIEPVCLIPVFVKDLLLD